MRRQTFYEYLLCRIEFAVAVGLFVEFDYYIKLKCDFPEPKTEEEFDKVKSQILKFEAPSDANYLEEYKVKGDLSFPCMKFAATCKTNPKEIATRLKPYIEEVHGVGEVRVVGGYLNIFFDKTEFFLNS